MQEQGTSWEAEAEPGYALLATSEPSADATSTQTWAAIDDTGEWPSSPPGRARRTQTDHGTYPGRGALDDRAGLAVPEQGPGGRRAAGTGLAGRAAGLAPPADPAADGAGGFTPRRHGGAAAGMQGIVTGDRNQPGFPGKPAEFTGLRESINAQDSPSASPDRGAAHRWDDPGPRTGTSPQRARAVPGRRAGASTAPTPAKPRTRPRTARSNRLLAMLLVAPVVVVMVVVGVYVYLSSGHQVVPPAHLSATPTAVAGSPEPTLGPWKHIDTRADDPVPLSLAELFPARVTATGAAATRTVERAGTTCTRAVIGTDLQAAVRKGHCTQVMRASYLSANRKMMATVGVLNLIDTSAAERAGHASGSTEFISQLRSRHGPTRNLTQGTGLEEAEVKGHYLILIWSEFANLHSPSGKRQRKELEDFSTALINDTVNLSLSSRMVTGQPATS